MKIFILPISFVVLAFSGIGTKASAQHYDTRVDVARLADEGREHHGEDRDDWRGGPGGRLAGELDQLDREVRRVRQDIRTAGGGDRRIRFQFGRVVQATDRLNRHFRRGDDRREIWRGVQEVRGDLSRVERELRDRFRGSRR